MTVGIRCAFLLPLAESVLHRACLGDGAADPEGASALAAPAGQAGAKAAAPKLGRQDSRF